MPDRIYSVGSTSTSCTFGNLIEFVHQDILSKFPANFFKDEVVSTTMAFRQIKKYKDNSMVEFVKKEKPRLLIRPNYEVGDDSIPFRDTPLTMNVYSNPGGMSRHSILPFIQDSHRGYSVGYRLNRDRLSFDITIQVETLTKQLDTYKALENTIGFSRPYQLETSLETVIPFQMVDYISKIINKPLDIGKPITIPPILQYLQTHSNYPVTYKIRNSTSKPEFFIYYGVPIRVIYDDLTIDDGSRKGMTDDAYTITFKVTTEFNHPGAFILIGSEISALNDMEFDLTIQDEDDSTFIPIYTIDRILEDKDNYFEGFKIYTSTIVKTEKENEGKDDFCDLEEMIEVDYIRILRRYNASRIPSDILFRFQVFKNKTQLTEDLDYIIDFNQMKLAIHNSDPNATYRIIVFQNKIRCNEELENEMVLATKDKNYKDLYTPYDDNHGLTGYDHFFKDKNGLQVMTRPTNKDPKNK